MRNFAPPGGQVATATDVHGYLNVFTVAKDGALYTKWDCTSLWCGPTALTATGFAPTGANVSAINISNLALDVFLVDNTGTIDGFANTGAAWQGPTAIAANFAQPGAVTVPAIEGSQLDLFSAAPGVPSGVIESVYTNAWSAPAVMP
jgi:hypothetical protein